MLHGLGFVHLSLLIKLKPFYGEHLLSFCLISVVGTLVLLDDGGAFSGGG